MDRHGNPCPPDKILNPVTGNCVSRKGAKGRELLKNDVNAIQDNGRTLVTQAIRDHNLDKFIEYMANPTIDVNKYDSHLGNPLIHALQSYIFASTVTHDGYEPIYREMVLRLLNAPGINVNVGMNGSIFMNTLRSQDIEILRKLLEFPDLIIDCQSLNVASIMAMEGEPEILRQILVDGRFNPSYGKYPYPAIPADNPINNVISYYNYKIEHDIAAGRGEETNAITAAILGQLLAYKPEWAEGRDLSRFGLTFANIRNDRTAINRRHTARNAATLAWMRARGLPRPKARKTRKN